MQEVNLRMLIRISLHRLKYTLLGKSAALGRDNGKVYLPTRRRDIT